jgi:hypothetical protein
VSDTIPISSGLSGLHVVEILEAASRSIAARGDPIPLQSTPKMKKLVS